MVRGEGARIVTRGRASCFERGELLREEVDLLPRIRHKVFLFPELAPLFGLRNEDLLGSFSILTRVLDGQGLSTDSGVHGRRGHTGDYIFAWIGCTTPIPTTCGRRWGSSARGSSSSRCRTRNSRMPSSSTAPPADVPTASGLASAAMPSPTSSTTSGETPAASAAWPGSETPTPSRSCSGSRPLRRCSPACVGRSRSGARARGRTRPTTSRRRLSKGHSAPCRFSTPSPAGMPSSKDVSSSPSRISRSSLARRSSRPRTIAVRHRRITIWHQAGVPARELAERAGHARPSMSLDVYSHVMPPDEVPAERFVSLLTERREVNP